MAQSKEAIDGLPLVSVLIPSYNAAATLGETLDSVLRQTYPHIEIIVVDDGSTDNTASVLERYTGKVQAIRAPNGGVAAARNRGLRCARGEYVALLDHDDICEPERIRQQVDYLLANPDVLLCSSDFSAFTSDGEVARSYIARYYNMVSSAAGGVRSLYGHAAGSSALDTYSGHIYDNMVAGNFVHPPTVMFRHAIADQVGEFNEQFRYVCDWDWLTRASRLGKIGFIERPLLRYRLSASQLSGRGNQAREMLEVIQVYERLQETNPELYRRRAAEFRHRIGSCYLSAASAYAENQPGKSLATLRTSIRYAGIRLATIKVLIKVLLPQKLLALLRNVLSKK